MNESQLQQQIIIFYNNNYCLKNMNPRGLILAIPNGGSRHFLEAKTLKATGLLAGASDLILITPQGKLMFIELKIEKGIQSETQKDFENRVSALGYEYYIIKSLEQFKNIL